MTLFVVGLLRRGGAGCHRLSEAPKWSSATDAVGKLSLARAGQLAHHHTAPAGHGHQQQREPILVPTLLVGLVPAGRATAAPSRPRWCGEGGDPAALVSAGGEAGQCPGGEGDPREAEDHGGAE